MKNSKITKIVYTIVGLFTTVFVFGQDGPTGFDDDVIDNEPISPIDDHIIIGVLIAILFAIYSIQKKYSTEDYSIKKQIYFFFGCTKGRGKSEGSGQPHVQAPPLAGLYFQAPPSCRPVISGLFFFQP